MKYMTKMIPLLAILLSLLLLCTACSVYTLDAYLPPLMDDNTLLPCLTKITVIRASDGAQATLTDPLDLSTMLLQLEGIQCVRDRVSLEQFSEEYPLVYTLKFYATTGETTLYICGDEEFYLGRYSYLALRSGVDFYYLNSLFSDPS